MKKSLLLIFILVLSLVFVACATENPNEDLTDQGPIVEDPIPEDDEDTDDDTDDEDVDEDVDDEENQVVDPTPETYTETVTLYFVSNSYIMTGDETGEVMVSEEREVEYDDTSLEEAVVRALMDGPEDSETMETLIPESVTLSSVEIEDGTAFVDFDREGLSGGSMQESFTIRQIVDSLIELATVDRVQFLVDGQKDESLMGHIEISEPFVGE